MARIAWNTAGSRFFEAGIDRGVLYIDALEGVPWVGLISVDENPSGAEPRPYYIDGEKYLNLSTVDEFEASVNAYTYPVEFGQCDGTAQIRSGLFFGQQPRKSFGLSYRTMIGNDTQGNEAYYKIHLVYNALATPSARSAQSYADSIDASDFTWDLTTKNNLVSGYASTAHVIVDTRYTNPVKLSQIEDILYGNDEGVARLPTPAELIAIFDVPLEWSVTDNGDGTFFISGPDENVWSIGNDMVMLDHPDIDVIDVDSFTLNYDE